MSASRPQRRRGAGAAGASIASAVVSARAGSASAICCLLLLALRREIAANGCEQTRELFPLGERKAGENLVHHGVQTLAQASQFLAALVGQVEPAGAAIV